MDSHSSEIRWLSKTLEKISKRLRKVEVLSRLAGEKIVKTFLGLLDTPDTYEGYAGWMSIVNNDETGLIFDPGSGVAWQEWDAIILIHDNGGGVFIYDPTQSGFTAALVKATADDVIYVPPATITGNHTITTGVEIWGAGRDKTIFSGIITLTSDSVLNNLSVIRSVSEADAITKGVIGTDNGTCYIYDCICKVINASRGEVRVIDQPAGGTTEIWESNLLAVVAGYTTGVGRYNHGSYGIYITYDGEVIHRFCNVRATQDSTDQRNPFYDTSGSSFTPAGVVSAGAFNVTAEAGILVAGLVVDNWYSLENTGGPWDNGDVADNLQYSWCISFDAGVTWDLVENLVSGGTRQLFLPPDVEHTEAVGVNHARIYFKAITNSVKIRVADGAGAFGDNVGAMGYSLENATVELDATEAYASDIVDPIGATVPIPHLGDRAAYDVDDYDIKHASDIYNAIFQRHLPDLGNVGNVVTDDGSEWISAPAGALSHPIVLDDGSILTLAADAITITLDYHIVAAQAGVADDLDTINNGTNDQILVLQADTGDTITVKDAVGNIFLNGGADFDLVDDKTLMLFYDGTNWSDIGAGGGGGGGACPDDGWLCDYWEPAVVALGEEIMFDVFGDVAMLWIN